MLFTVLLPAEAASAVAAECRCVVPGLPIWTAAVIGGRPCHNSTINRNKRKLGLCVCPAARDKPFSDLCSSWVKDSCVGTCAHAPASGKRRTPLMDSCMAAF